MQTGIRHRKGSWHASFINVLVQPQHNFIQCIRALIVVDNSFLSRQHAGRRVHFHLDVILGMVLPVVRAGGAVVHVEAVVIHLLILWWDPE